MRLGIVGVGDMGGAMAGRALQDGLEVVVCDVNPDACEALRDKGAEIAKSPRELAAKVDMAAVVVLDDTQVREVVAGEEGLLAAGRSDLDIVIHSTIHLPTLYEVAELARAAGCTLFDAGVSGHSRGAERGQLAVMVGSDEASLERCRPAFESYGGLVVRVGELGAGMKAKVARNLIGYVQCSAVYEGLRLAEEAGVDVPALAEIVRHSEAQGQLVNFFLSRPSVRPATPESDSGRDWLQVARATAPVAHKDLSAALALARELGIRLPVSEESERRLEAVWGLEEGERV